MAHEVNQKNIERQQTIIIKATKDLEDMVRHNIVARINNTRRIYHGCINLLSLEIQAMRLDVILGRAIMSNSNTLIRAVIEKQNNIYSEIIELLFEDKEHMQEGIYIERMNKVRDCRIINDKTLLTC